MTALVTLTARCPLATRTRLFSAGRAGDDVLVDPFAAAQPGTLPVPNRLAVDHAIRLALTFDADISARCEWTRRHRFIDGLPKGYQITLANSPLARNGWIADTSRRWPLTQLHLAEDIGVPHDPARAGASLVELLVAPILFDDDSGAVDACLTALAASVHTADVGGPPRCTADVASTPYGPSCMVVELTACPVPSRAVAAEARRQAELLVRGSQVVPVVVAYDEREDRTVVLHPWAEDSGDLPEPDLPPLAIDPAWIARIRRTMTATRPAPA